MSGTCPWAENLKKKKKKVVKHCTLGRQSYEKVTESARELDGKKHRRKCTTQQNTNFKKLSNGSSLIVWHFDIPLFFTTEGVYRSGSGIF